MTREERKLAVEEAAQLRARGWSNTRIAEKMGCDQTTIFDWLHDVPRPPRDCLACGKSFRPSHGNQRCCSEDCRLENDRARKQRCADSARANCIDCGDPLREGSAWNSRNASRCRTCWALSEAERVHPRSEQIVKWWAEGALFSEIADRLGWTINHLAVEFHRLREKGYDLPYRYSEGKRAGHVFPDQVAA